MKFNRAIIGFAMLLAAAPIAGADNLQARFELERPLAGTFEVGQRGRVVIADDVFGQSRNFPNDVRIFGSDGIQWPCFLHVPVGKVDTTSVGLNILNSAWVDGAEPYLQFDVVVPEVGGKTPVHNRLELITTGSEFVRRVEIYTGDEKAGSMASGYLIEFPQRRDARNRTIRYPDSDINRLHVRIYPNAQAANEKFGISRAYLHHRIEKEAEREPVRFIELPVDGRDRDEDAQTQVIDIRQTDRPVEFITFAVDNLSYARCVSVYGRNDEREEWRWVGGGEIHALPGDRNDTILVNARCRFLKIQVYHYDDQPLEISEIRLEAIPRYLVFEAASDRTASLYYRGWDIARSRYDLQSRIGKAELETLPVVGMLEARPNAMARAQPWRKYSKLLAGVAVGAVSLLVIWIIVGMLRQQPPEEPS